MGWLQCNSTLEDTKITETKLFDSHDFTFHELTLVISALCSAFAIIVSLLLMFMHAIRYSRPTEQKHIIRILFMVPIYAMVSFLSIVFYSHSVYYEVMRDCYEAIAIASFFILMCAYVGDDLRQQKEYFRKIKPKPWVWPMKYFQKCAGGENGWLRTPRSGLTWFNVIWVCVFQYCFVRVSMTITAVVTQYFGRYCLETLSPAFAHVWVMVIEGVAVSVTMYSIIQFYFQLREDTAQHKPILKVLAIKLVIFLSFWQTILISFLTSSGAIKATPQIQTPDIKVGIPSMLLCIEMALFAVFHLWAFSYRPYVIGSKSWQDVYGHLNDETQPRYQGGPLGIKAIAQCFNPWDLIKATGRAGKWLFRDRKHRMQDASYATVADAQKLNDLNVPTEYAGATHVPTNLKAERADEADAGLLANTQNPAQVHTYSNRESDSSGHSPWTEVEAKEYFQDEQMRRQNPRRDDFQTAQYAPNPYDAVYKETQPYSEVAPSPNIRPQIPGVLRPAGTGAERAGQTPNLPMVTRQDIEGMQQLQGQTVPYPRSMASVNARTNLPPAKMPSVPPGQGGGGGFI